MDASILTPAEVASQCDNPTGDLGRAVGQWMARANLLISKAAYSELEIDYGARVLEIGMGNGALVNFIVTSDNAVRYTGLDISGDMIEEARKHNADLIKNQRVEFVKASVENIPFMANSFDRAVSVNGIYFWDVPKALSEIHRVLVGGGKLVIASNSPETMASNPFVKLKRNFKKIELNKDKLISLHKEAGFSTVTVQDYTEDAKRMDGTPYVRKSYITTAVK